MSRETDSPHSDSSMMGDDAGCQLKAARIKKQFDIAFHPYRIDLFLYYTCFLIKLQQTHNLPRQLLMHKTRLNRALRIENTDKLSQLAILPSAEQQVAQS